VRTWAGFVYVAFIVDVYAQRVVAWHAATTKRTDLVMIPLRMALWQRVSPVGEFVTLIGDGTRQRTGDSPRGTVSSTGVLDVSDMTVSSTDVQLHALDTGGPGQPVLILHGTREPVEDLEHWQRLVWKGDEQPPEVEVLNRRYLLLARVERGERDFAFALLPLPNRAFACAVLMHDLWLPFVPASPLPNPGQVILFLRDTSGWRCHSGQGCFVSEPCSERSSW
jgi:hypothetical protein